MLNFMYSSGLSADWSRSPTVHPVPPLPRPTTWTWASSTRLGSRPCHARADSGAPLSHHAPSWEARLARGLPALVQSVQNGKGGMPAGGLCADCSPQDFDSLTRFMSGPTP